MAKQYKKLQKKVYPKVKEPRKKEKENFGKDYLLLAVVAFLWLTSPVASHLIGRLEVTVNDQLPLEMQVEDTDFVAVEKEADREVRP